MKDPEDGYIEASSLFIIVILNDDINPTRPFIIAVFEESYSQLSICLFILGITENDI